MLQTDLVKPLLLAINKSCCALQRSCIFGVSIKTLLLAIVAFKEKAGLDSTVSLKLLQVGARLCSMWMQRLCSACTAW